jgi:hypothetical protein
MQFLVTCEVVVEADGPTEAAAAGEEALVELLMAGSPRPILTVQTCDAELRRTGAPQDVDLSKL